MKFGEKVKNMGVKILIWIFWILFGLYIIKEFKDTFFYSTSNPPERVYDPTQRNKN